MPAPDQDDDEMDADEDDDGKPERVFDEWYDYDYETHTLTPKPLIPARPRKKATKPSGQLPRAGWTSWRSLRA